MSKSEKYMVFTIKSRIIEILRILTTSILDNWMEKVGRTSKSDVKQKEKKP